MSKRKAIDASVDATLSRLYSSIKGSHELVSKSRGLLIFPEVIQAVRDGMHGANRRHSRSYDEAKPESYLSGPY